jgi:NitT/TauT family transport system substrate-binding protein
MRLFRNTLLAVITLIMSMQLSHAADALRPLEKSSIKIGLAVEAATYLPIYLAESKGFFKEEGLDVQLYIFKGDAGAIQALAGNSVDIDVASLTGLINALDAKQPFVAFWGGFNQADFDWYSTKISSLKDAKDKKFGITQYGALTDIVTRAALKKAGLNPEKDVQILQVGGSPSALAAMGAGRLDVAILSAPAKFLAQEKGMIHLMSERKDLTPDWPKHVVYSNKAFLKDNPETVKAFLRAMVKGLDYMNANHAAAADELVKRLKFKKEHAMLAVEEALPDYDRNGVVNPQGLDAFWKLEVEAGDVKERWTDDKWLDTSLIDAARNTPGGIEAVK